MPPGRGGIIGIPILLPVGCIRWTKGGTWELGCHADSPRTAAANLVFFENRALVAATVFDTPVFMTLDTGAEATDLNANFAEQFKGPVDLVAKKGTASAEGAGGTAVIESLTLPEVTVTLGGRRTALRPANVTMQKNPAMGGRCCVGNIGLDLLLQTGDVTIDFRSMTVRLR